MAVTADRRSHLVSAGQTGQHHVAIRRMFTLGKDVLARGILRVTLGDELIEPLAPIRGHVRFEPLQRQPLRHHLARFEIVIND